MSLTNRKQPIDLRAILIQGDSVRMTWGMDEPSDEGRKPLRRDRQPRGPAPSTTPTDDALSLRVAEELDYVRRTLEAAGDQLSGDPILIRRHAAALQSLDIVGQILGHLGNVIRSSDPRSAVEAIGKADLKARLARRGAL